MSDWDRLLDDMERRVEMAERFLAGEDLELDEFARPHTLGPMPTAYAARARRIHEATVLVEARMAEEMDRIVGVARAAGPARAFRSERPEPVYFDRSA